MGKTLQKLKRELNCTYSRATFCNIGDLNGHFNKEASQANHKEGKTNVGMTLQKLSIQKKKAKRKKNKSMETET